jgi:D-alanyl-D-alanine carboxypeptidase
MNAEARRLGMTGSNFVNANGLHSSQHYTTARDMAVLAYALRREFPQYAAYFGIEAVQYGDHLDRNYNILLGRFDGADGMKTGFVCASGFNVVASATRNGKTLVAVVMGATSQEERAEKAANLLARGFADTGPGSAALSTMQPGESEPKGPVNMRATVCTKGAEADRWDGRDVEGRMQINSPYITAMTREPRTAIVSLGGATGPKAVPEAAIEDSQFASVPIPTPRPNRVNEEFMPMALTGDAKLRKGVALPSASN